MHGNVTLSAKQFDFSNPILTLDGADSTLIMELVSSQMYYRKEVVGDNLNELLLKEIDSFFKKNGLHLEDLGAIAVNYGPGSYSRLRGVLMWAKTTAFFLKIPLLGFDIFTIINHFVNESLNPLPRALSTNKIPLKSIPTSVVKRVMKNFWSDNLCIYIYRVTRNIFFGCLYMGGERLWKITPITRIFDYYSIKNKERKVDNDFTIKNFSTEKIGDWLWKTKVKDFPDNQKTKVEEQIKKKNFFFFFINDKNIENFNTMAVTYGKGFFIELETAFFFQKWMEEVNQGVRGKNKFLFLPSIYQCAKVHLSKNFLNKYQDSPLTVNPIYCREFGE